MNNTSNFLINNTVTQPTSLLEGVFQIIEELGAYPTIEGTPNQIITTSDVSANVVILSTPQDIGTDSNVQFSSLVINDLEQNGGMLLLNPDVGSAPQSGLVLGCLDTLGTCGWVSVSGGISNVTNISGVPNQINVTNISGNYLLGTPQNIDISANVTFASIEIGALQVNGSGAQVGQVLTAVDALGNVAWTSISGVATNISGVPNQINVTNVSGNYVLGTPQNIDISANVAFASIEIGALQVNISGAQAGQVLTAVDTLGNAIWTSISGTTSISISGTINQINVNGISGAYILSTPQDISPLSNVTFNSIVTPNYVACEQLYCNTTAAFAGDVFVSSGTVTPGNVLTCIDNSGNTQWRPPATVSGIIGVSSVVGTPDQIIASASIGDVVLSLPQDIAQTSNVVFNQVSAGSAALDTALSIGSFLNLAPTNTPQIGNVLAATTTAGDCDWVEINPGIQSINSASPAQIQVFTDISGGVLLELPQDIAQDSDVTFGSITTDSIATLSGISVGQYINLTSDPQLNFVQPTVGYLLTCVDLCGTAMWQPLDISGDIGVSSITGTPDQIIADASTGAVTLSLPQDIGLSSNVSFGGVDTDELSVGNYFNVNYTNFSGAPTPGYIFTAIDACGNGTWLPPVSVSGIIGVSSIAGTTNQITASSATGNVVLSLPQNIDISANMQINQMSLQTLTAATSITVGNQFLLNQPNLSGVQGGFVLTSLDVCGTASWRPLSSSGATGVTSITGTPRQITASSSTGSVVLSLPQNLDASSNVAFGSLNTTALTFPPTISGNIMMSNSSGNITLQPIPAIPAPTYYYNYGFDNGNDLYATGVTFTGSGAVSSSNGITLSGGKLFLAPNKKYMVNASIEVSNLPYSIFSNNPEGTVNLIVSGNSNPSGYLYPLISQNFTDLSGTAIVSNKVQCITPSGSASTISSLVSSANTSIKSFNITAFVNPYKVAVAPYSTNNNLTIYSQNAIASTTPLIYADQTASKAITNLPSQTSAVGGDIASAVQSSFNIPFFGVTNCIAATSTDTFSYSVISNNVASITQLAFTDLPNDTDWVKSTNILPTGLTGANRYTICIGGTNCLILSSTSGNGILYNLLTNTITAITTPMNNGVVQITYNPQAQIFVAVTQTSAYKTASGGVTFTNFATSIPAVGGTLSGVGYNQTTQRYLFIAQYSATNQTNFYRTTDLVTFSSVYVAYGGLYKYVIVGSSTGVNTSYSYRSTMMVSSVSTGSNANVLISNDNDSQWFNTTNNLITTGAYQITFAGGAWLCTAGVSQNTIAYMTNTITGSWTTKTLQTTDNFTNCTGLFNAFFVSCTQPFIINASYMYSYSNIGYIPEPNRIFIGGQNLSSQLYTGTGWYDYPFASLSIRQQYWDTMMLSVTGKVNNTILHKSNLQVKIRNLNVGEYCSFIYAPIIYAAYALSLQGTGCTILGNREVPIQSTGYQNITLNSFIQTTSNANIQLVLSGQSISYAIASVGPSSSISITEIN